MKKLINNFGSICFWLLIPLFIGWIWSDNSTFPKMFWTLVVLVGACSVGIKLIENREKKEKKGVSENHTVDCKGFSSRTNKKMDLMFQQRLKEEMDKKNDEPT